MTIDFINKNTFALRLMSIIIMFSIQSYSQSLRLYVIPPPDELNWKNPHTLLRSLSINYLKIIIIHIKLEPWDISWYNWPIWVIP